MVRIRGKQRRRVAPNFVDVLDDVERLANGFVVVNEDRDLLVNRVHL